MARVSGVLVWAPGRELAAGRADDEQVVTGADLRGFPLRVRGYFQLQGVVEGELEVPVVDQRACKPVIEGAEQRGGGELAVAGHRPGLLAVLGDLDRFLLDDDLSAGRGDILAPEGRPDAVDAGGVLRQSVSAERAE